MKVYAIPSHARVIATLGFFLAVGLAFFVATPPAKAKIYQGQIKGNSFGSISLTVTKANGKWSVDKLRTGIITATCGDGGFGYTYGGLSFDPPDNRVRPDGGFDVRQDTGKGEFTRFAGRLKSGGGAYGFFKRRWLADLPPGVCSTGTVEWVAHER